MGTFVARRVGLAIPTLFLVSVVVFLVLRVMPGDVTTVLLQDVHYSKQDAEQLRSRLGIDKPVVKQYSSWIGGVLKGNFGKSLLNGQAIWPKLRSALPVTIELTVLALLVSIAI